jgi:hypothetical protein
VRPSGIWTTGYAESTQLALVDIADSNSATSFEQRVGPGAQVRTTGVGGISGEACPLSVQGFLGNGNVNAEPGETFQSVDPINPALVEGAPVVDRGNIFVDFDPSLPGFQLLPETDLVGAPRTADGDGDGLPVVDMGAYEFQRPD